MTLLESKVYLQDINKVLLNINSFDQIKNKTLFITGCNGLICSSLVDLLIIANTKLNLNIRIFLASRNVQKTKQRFNNSSCCEYIEYDSTKPLIFKDNADYYIHGASNASPDIIIKEPVETIISNIYGLKEILNKAGTNRVLYISSSEVYGNIITDNPIEENQIGTLEILNPRSSYGQSKRTAETLCSSYISEYNSNVVIARPGHIYGPTASKNDIRVSSQFMYNAAEGKDLVLKSEGLQLRSYTYCLDCASALFTILTKGKTGEAYNISNKHSIISIAQMAQLYADYANVKLLFELPKKEEIKAFNPMNNSSLDSKKLETLGWQPCFTKEEGFKNSISIIKELLNEVC